MNIRRFFQWLGGADPDAVAQVRSAGTLAAGLGGTVLMTAVLAAGAMTMALHDWVHLRYEVAAVTGVLWGLAILNLDRWLLAASRRQARWWLTIALALPRVMLAGVIGTVIAEPLVQRVFTHEVAAQVGRDREDQAKKDGRVVDARYAEIATLEKQQATLERTLRGGAEPALSTNPDYVAAKADERRASDALAAAQLRVGCEEAGTCGTKKRGCGPQCNRNLDVLAQRRREAAAAHEHLVELERRLGADAQRAGRVARAQAAPELARVERELARLRRDRAADRRRATHALVAPVGLLDREEALAHLGSDHPVVDHTAWLFRLMLMAIDITPILVKTGMLLGRTTIVERVQEAVEDHELARLTATQEAEDDAHAVSVKLVVTEAEMLRDEQEAALKDMVKQLAAVQRRVWQRQIDDFERSVAAAHPAAAPAPPAGAPVRRPNRITKAPAAP